jgi:hypothetical protein
VAAEPKFSITPKQIVVTSDAGQSKVYGMPDPVFTYSFAPVLLSGDRITGAPGREEGSNAGTYQYTLGTLSAGPNYSLIMDSSVKFKINKADLSITAADKTKCYDGAVENTFNEIICQGLMNGDTPSSLNGTLTFSGNAVTAVNPGSYTIIPSGLTSGNYNIVYHNGTLKIQSLPAPVITGLTSLCEKTSGVLYTTEAGMSDYSWDISSGGVISAGSSANEIAVNWNNAGNHFIGVNYTDANGCRAAAAIRKNITVNPYPGDAGDINGSVTINGGSTEVSFVVTPISNASSYEWSLPAGATLKSGSGTNSIKVDFDKRATSGIITIAGSNACGQGKASNLTVTLIPPPGPAGSITGQSTFGKGAQGVVYSVDPIENATDYTWSLPLGARIVSGNNTNVITVDFGMSAIPGDITVYGSNTAGNGPVSPPFKITLQGTKFLMYPVPNDGYFTVKITYPFETEFNIRIFNQSGVKIYEVRKLQTVNGYFEKAIDIRGVPSGKYYMQFFSNYFSEVREILIRKN